MINYYEDIAVETIQNETWKEIRLRKKMNCGMKYGMRKK